MKREILLDCGAFSVRNKPDEQIDLDKYIKFLKDHGHLFSSYFNLDYIDDDLTPKEKGEKSFKNYQIMVDKGLSPIPVFHHGSDLSILEYYLDHSDCVGLGNISDKNEQRKPWLDYLFQNHLHGKRVHGFGVTSVELLLIYPWTTVDSSTYIQTAKYGKIHVPYYKNGEYDYANNEGRTISVSTESISHANKLEQHYVHARTKDRNQIDHYLEHECGSSFKSVSESSKERLWINARFFMKVEQGVTSTIYLSVSPTNREQISILKELSKKEILVSYYYVLENQKKFLELCEED